MMASLNRRQCLTVIVLAGAFLLSSCGPGKPAKARPKPYTKDQLIEANKADTRRESDDIDAYIRRHGWVMKFSGSGLRYMFLAQSTKGDSARNGAFAKVSYQVELLDGTICYTSVKDGLKTFKIGEDHVESGIHEVILLMKTGDRIRFILPSARAHGLLGDGDRIPPRAPVMYEMELISLR